MRLVQMDRFVDANLSLIQSIADDADLASKVGLPYDIVPAYSDSRKVMYKSLNCLSYRKPFDFHS